MQPDGFVVGQIRPLKKSTALAAWGHLLWRLQSALHLVFLALSLQQTHNKSRKQLAELPSRAAHLPHKTSPVDNISLRTTVNPNCLLRKIKKAVADQNQAVKVNKRRKKQKPSSTKKPHPLLSSPQAHSSHLPRVLLHFWRSL